MAPTPATITISPFRKDIIRVEHLLEEVNARLKVIDLNGRITHEEFERRTSVHKFFVLDAELALKADYIRRMTANQVMMELSQLNNKLHVLKAQEDARREEPKAKPVPVETGKDTYEDDAAIRFSLLEFD